MYHRLPVPSVCGTQNNTDLAPVTLRPIGIENNCRKKPQLLCRTGHTVFTQTCSGQHCRRLRIIKDFLCRARGRYCRCCQHPETGEKMRWRYMKPLPKA